MGTKLAKGEQSTKELFIGQMWSYLRNNFHKFNQTNQIKIALELCKKDVPQEIKGSLQVTEMPVIRKTSGEATVPINLEFNIGTPVVTGNPRPPAEAPADN